MHDIPNGRLAVCMTLSTSTTSSNKIYLTKAVPANFLPHTIESIPPQQKHPKCPREHDFQVRGGSWDKSDQGSTKSSWAWLYGRGKYLRTMNKKGPVGPTVIIDLKFDILDFSNEAIKHVVHFGLLC